MSEIYVEWIGYFASFFVAISFMFRDIKKLRITNMIGGIAFVVYGYLIDSWPVILTNFFIVLMHIYHLFRDRKAKPENVL